MKFVLWLRDHWYRRLRNIDIKILWPSCKAGARDLDHAKAAFAAHALNDAAWLVLGEDEACRRIDDLT